MQLVPGQPVVLLTQGLRDDYYAQTEQSHLSFHSCEKLSVSEEQSWHVLVSWSPSSGRSEPKSVVADSCGVSFEEQSLARAALGSLYNSRSHGCQAAADECLSAPALSGSNHDLPISVSPESPLARSRQPWVGWLSGLVRWPTWKVDRSWLAETALLSWGSRKGCALVPDEARGAFGIRGSEIRKRGHSTCAA